MAASLAYAASMMTQLLTVITYKAYKGTILSQNLASDIKL